ncbi:MAG: phosphate ABC transporter permease subunit PstC, partial [Bdellovibrionales bacterium]|nr:phosphate ABC transporter permease subunit PstC [Bdellovibrionales bacterium]
GYVVGRQRARALSYNSLNALPARPQYYGAFVSLSVGIPALLVAVIWLIAEPIVLQGIVRSTPGGNFASMSHAEFSVSFSQIKNVASGVFPAGALESYLKLAVQRYVESKARYDSLGAFGMLAVSCLGFLFGVSRVRASLHARVIVERIVKLFLFLSSNCAVLTTIGIICSLIFESIRFFQLVPFTEFIFGTRWSPQMAIRADQVGSSGAFGAIPVFVGTGLIAVIALAVAGPVGLMTAIYLSEYASRRTRSVVKPLIEILAGIPTVVYGFFAALTVAPLIRDFGIWCGLSVSSESALAAGVVMGVCIIPFVSSLSDDVIHAVPRSLRDGSLALGATKSETIKRVVFPAALPGIVGAFMLAVSRAVGETMIVVMAAGLAANLTLDPLDNVTTVTVQIVTLLVGDQEFDSAKTLAAFALGLVLFCVTLLLNVIALRVVKRYRERYE